MVFFLGSNHLRSYVNEIRSLKKRICPLGIWSYFGRLEHWQVVCWQHDWKYASDIWAFGCTFKKYMYTYASILYKKKYTSVVLSICKSCASWTTHFYPKERTTYNPQPPPKKTLRSPCLRDGKKQLLRCRHRDLAFRCILAIRRRSFGQVHDFGGTTWESTQPCHWSKNHWWKKV